MLVGGGRTTSPLHSEGTVVLVFGPLRAHVGEARGCGDQLCHLRLRETFLESTVAPRLPVRGRAERTLRLLPWTLVLSWVSGCHGVKAPPDSTGTGTGTGTGGAEEGVDTGLRPEPYFPFQLTWGDSITVVSTDDAPGWTLGLAGIAPDRSEAWTGEDCQDGHVEDDGTHFAYCHALGPNGLEISFGASRDDVENGTTAVGRGWKETTILALFSPDFSLPAAVGHSHEGDCFEIGNLGAWEHFDHCYELGYMYEDVR